MEKYAGSAVLEVDGKEIEIVELSVTKNPGRKLVKAMNSKGRARGYAQGIATWELSLTAVNPLDDTLGIDWWAIDNAKVTVYPLGHNEQRTSYVECFVTEVGEKYTVDNEEVIDIKMSALDEVKE